jgi:hypothetical protein
MRTDGLHVSVSAIDGRGLVETSGEAAKSWGSTGIGQWHLREPIADAQHRRHGWGGRLGRMR